MDEIITNKKIFPFPLELEKCSNHLSGVFDSIGTGTNTCLLLVGLEASRPVILTLSGAYLAVEICAKFCSVLCPSTDGLRKEFCELCSEQLV